MLGGVGRELLEAGHGTLPGLLVGDRIVDDTGHHEHGVRPGDLGRANARLEALHAAAADGLIGVGEGALPVQGVHDAVDLDTGLLSLGPQVLGLGVAGGSVDLDAVEPGLAGELHLS